MDEFTSTDSLYIRHGDDGVITVTGEIDMAGGPILEAAILQTEGEGPLVIDVRGVSFIDSSGLRSLLEASRRARSRDANLVLRNVGPEVARLLEITGTTEQFEVHYR